MRPHADGHWSGLASATGTQWSEYADFATRRCTVLAATELRHLIAPLGWGQYLPQGFRGAECSLLWDHDHWRTVGPRVDACGTVRLTDKTWIVGNGAERPGVTMTYGNLEAVHGARLLRAVGHFPSSVQDGDGFGDNDRRNDAWRDTLKHLRPALERLADEHRPDEITFSADFNVDLQREAWRDRINTALAPLDMTVKAPTEGTHHDRAIDGHATTMRCTPSGTPQVHPKRPGFDHQLVVTVLTSKEKP